MLKGVQILRIGVVITAVTLVASHGLGIAHEFTAFLMGVGCSLSLVGAGKRFIENNSQ